jgi:hypothetical protein
MKHERMIGALAAAVALGMVAGLMAQEAAAPAKDATVAPATVTCSAAKDTTAAKPQTLCPITGNKCSKDIFVDAEGVRIYCCCKDCIEKVKADPNAAIAKIKANGEQPECVPCAKCGMDASKCKCGMQTVPAEKPAAPAEAAAPVTKPAVPAEPAK